MIKEICVENFTDIPAAIQKGADRIELCDNLAVGGTTVSLGVLRHSAAYCRERGIPVMVIIRPRGGDFVYSDDEKAIMLADIRTAKDEMASGIVIGALTKEGDIDVAFMEVVIAATRPLPLTFHMAFDAIQEEKQESAIDWLASKGVERILTHGGPISASISETKERIKVLMEYAAERIILLPGGGITCENVQAISDYLDAKEAHGTRII